MSDKMKVNRRAFLRGAVAVAAAPLLPVALFYMSHAEAAAANAMGGNVARLLQEGIHKLATEQYANYPSELAGIFRSHHIPVLRHPKLRDAVSLAIG